MKTALLHYWLTNLRGGEKVFAALCELLPEADVFTHALGAGMRDGHGRPEDAAPRENGRMPPGCATIWGHPVRESWIAKLPMGRRVPQAYLPLMPYAAKALDLRAYDLIVSSESGPIIGVAKRTGQRHVCYCHSPMRYVWDMYDRYYAAAGRGEKIAMKIFRKHLRYHDLKSAESVDRFVANSRFVAERIKRIYGRDSAVVHPPVDVEFFRGRGSGVAGLASPPFEPGSYYLWSGELRAYKRPDIAVEACARTGRKLVVIGRGGMRETLEKRTAAEGGIKFLGRVSDEVLKAAYANAKALLFPGVEDFGIVPVEAQAAGTPVIALGKGGALDSVIPGVTGLFYDDESVEGLCGAIEEFEGCGGFDSDACRKNADRFAKAEFISKMQAMISSLSKS